MALGCESSQFAFFSRHYGCESSPSSTLAFDILFSDSTLTFDTPNSHIRYFELSHSILRTLTFDTPSSESELSHSTLFPLQTLTSVSPNSHIRYSELSHSIFRTLTSVSPNTELSHPLIDYNTTVRACAAARPVSSSQSQRVPRPAPREHSPLVTRCAVVCT